MTVPVLLGIGSNIDKKTNVIQALQALDSAEQLTLVCHSRVYETVAVDSNGLTAQQPNFYNLAARLDTELDVQPLIALLRSIEGRLGRIRTVDKFAPRSIDLDILFFGQNPSVIAGYQFPDPTISKLPHLACPLAEIAPDWTFPIPHLNGNSQPQPTLRTLADQLLEKTQTASQIVRILKIDQL